MRDEQREHSKNWPRPESMADAIVDAIKGDRYAVIQHNPGQEDWFEGSPAVATRFASLGLLLVKCHLPADHVKTETVKLRSWQTWRKRAWLTAINAPRSFR